MLSRSIGVSGSAIAISLVVVIANLGNNIVAPVLPTIKDYFGSSAGEVALMVSGFGLGRLVMDLPAGLLTDRVSPTRLFAAGILLTGAASALAAFSTSLQQLILFRTAMGFGSAIMSTVALVMLVNGARPKDRGKVLAFYSTAMLLGAAASPVIGGYLATLFSWRATFVFCALTPFISFPLNLAITGRTAHNPDSDPVEEKPSTAAKAPPVSQPVASKAPPTNLPAIASIYFSTFLNLFNYHGMQTTVLPLYAALVLGMSPAAIGGVLSSRAVFSILITLPGGALGDRFGRKQLLIPSMLILAAGNVYLTTGDSFLTFTITTLLLSMAVLANNMLSAATADLVPAPMMGRGMGMYRLTSDLGTVLGPVALGLIVDHFNFNAASVASAGMILLGAIACALLIPARTTPSPSRRGVQQ